MRLDDVVAPASSRKIDLYDPKVGADVTADATIDRWQAHREGKLRQTLYRSAMTTALDGEW
jgi:hypothetical protein